MLGFGALALIGCAEGQGDDAGRGSRLQTIVSGRAFFEGPAAGRKLVVTDFFDGVRGDRLGETTTDAQGAWSLDLGAISGSVLVELDESGAPPVVSVIADVIRLGEARDGVQLSPITHLTTVYAQHLRAERTGEVALVEARAAVEALFAGVAHGRVPAVDVLTVGAPSDSAGLVAGVLSVAFATQAEQLRTRPGSELGGDVSASALVRTYAEDLSDGFFDGRASGRPLRFAGQALDADTLRQGYGAAVLAFLGSDRNASTVGPSDFAPFAEGLRRNTGPLFPSDQPPRLDVEPPVITLLALRAGEGDPLPASPVLSGRFMIEAAAEDDGAIERLELLGTSTGAAGMDRVPDPAHGLWTIATERLPEGLQTWTLRARDTAGNETTVPVIFTIDRTAPIVTLTAPGLVASGTVAVSGRWLDASPGVVRVEVGGVERAQLVVSEGAFSAVIPIACGPPLELRAEGIDAAGNHSTWARTPTRCTATGPQLGLLPTAAIDESTLTIDRDRATGRLQFTEGQGTLQTEIREGASSPLRFQKFFPRLEPGAPNAPTFSVLTSGAVGLAYRWLVDGVERRAATSLALDGAGRAELPLDLSTLGPSLVDVAPDQRQTIELEARARNGAVQTRRFDFRMTVLSPPVWLSDCGPISGSLPFADLGVLYTANGEPEAFEARLAYVLDRGSQPLGPSEGVDLVWGGTMARTQITELSSQKWFGAWTADLLSSTFNAPCGLGPVTPGGYEATAGWTGLTRCIMGSFGLELPNDWIFWQTARHGPVSDLSVHATRTSLLSLTGAPYPVAGGRVRLPGDAPGRAVVRLVMPALSVAGQRYRFPTGFDPVPMGFQTMATVAGRYRLPGSDFVYDGRDFQLGRLEPDGFTIRYRTRPFTTRASLHTLSVELEPLSVTASHPRLPWATVEVRRDASCLATAVQTVRE